MFSQQSKLKALVPLQAFVAPAVLLLSLLLGCSEQPQRKDAGPWSLQTALVETEGKWEGPRWAGVADGTLVILTGIGVFAVDTQTLKEKWRRLGSFHCYGLSEPVLADGALIVPCYDDPQGLRWLALRDGAVLQEKRALMVEGLRPFRDGYAECFGDTFHGAKGKLLGGVGHYDNLAFCDAGDSVYVLYRELIPDTDREYDLFLSKWDPGKGRQEIWRTGGFFRRELLSISTLHIPSGIELLDSKLLVWRAARGWAVASADDGSILAKGELRGAGASVRSGAKILLYGREHTVSVFDTANCVMRDERLPVGPDAVVPCDGGFVIAHEWGVTFFDASGESLTQVRSIAPPDWKGACGACMARDEDSVYVVWGNRQPAGLLVGKLTGDPRR